MKNYFVLDGKQIPMSDETAESLREEQIYKIRDCFRIRDYVVMLVQCGMREVAAVGLSDGNYWKQVVSVGSALKITKGELRKILGNVYTPVTIKVEVVQ